MARELRSQGFGVHRFTEIAPRGTEDSVWVPEVVRRGWLIVTTDRGKKDKIMPRVLQREGATALLFNEQTPPTECVDRLVRHRSWIEKTVLRNDPPMLLRVSATEVSAYDFTRGGMLRVLKNGKIKVCL